MKKIILSVVALASMSFINAQVKVQSSPQVNIVDENPFMDVSSYVKYPNSYGKGLYFPSTDLTQWVFKTDRISRSTFSTAFDGMVVYNSGNGEVGENVSSGYNANTMGQKVSVKPGFYYFSNPTGKSTKTVNAGKWIPFSPSTASGNFWSLDGNGGIIQATIDPSNYAIKSGNFIGTKDNKKVTIGTNNIARLNIGEIPENVGGVDFDFVLKVYGKARFTKGIVTNNSTYPDYVFDNYFTGKSKENPNYKFKSLNEVESFIKENNHLPGVTSIKDLEKSEEGYYIDNTKLSIQTLEKVEELYLHMIEQQKEIKALKAEIAELKK